MACGFCTTTPVSPCPVCEAQPTGNTVIRRKRAPVARQAFPQARPAYVAPRVDAAQADRCTWADSVPCTEDDVTNGIACSRCDRIAERRAAPPRPVVSRTPTAPPPTRAQTQTVLVANAIRLAWQDGKVTVAAGLLAGVTDPDKREARIAMLELIDLNSARRRWISEKDAALRAGLINAMVEEFQAAHGFDPRFDSAPRSAPVTVVSARVVDLADAVTIIERATAPKALPAPLGALRGGDWAGLAERVRRGEISDAEARQIGQLWMTATGRA